MKHDASRSARACGLVLFVLLVIAAVAACTTEPQSSQQPAQMLAPTYRVPATAQPTIPPIVVKTPAAATLTARPASTKSATAPTRTPARTPARTLAPVRTPKPTPYDDHAAAKADGATAICADGTWSYSAHRSGTCSHHGGVHWWTGNLGPAGPGGH